jgi:hypothetical protein
MQGTFHIDEIPKQSIVLSLQRSSPTPLKSLIRIDYGRFMPDCLYTTHK